MASKGPTQALKIRNSLASVTMRVLHSGHSRVLFMIRSEQPRHIARCLQVRDKTD